MDWARMIVEQPVPEVSEVDVIRVVNRDFGVELFGSVLTALALFADSPRVRLAILKLADGDLDELYEAGKLAAQDYRDVLAAAEYPRYTSEIGFYDVSEDAEKEIIESDWRNYHEWLERKSSN